MKYPEYGPMQVYVIRNRKIIDHLRENIFISNDFRPYINLAYKTGYIILVA